MNNAAPLLWTTKQLAEQLGVHPSTVARMDAARQVPGRVQLGRSVRFRSDVIRQWVAAGCPPAEDFDEGVQTGCKPIRLAAESNGKRGVSN